MIAQAESEVRQLHMTQRSASVVSPERKCSKSTLSARSLEQGNISVERNLLQMPMNIDGHSTYRISDPGACGDSQTEIWGASD